MGDEHLNTILETRKVLVLRTLFPKPNRDISITSPKIDFLPEEFVGELDLIDPILPGIDEDDFDEDDFDEEEGEIDNDILQIEDEILREKLLNVNLLVDKIEALKLTPSIPFVLENPSSSPIPVVEEVDIFIVLEDSIPPSIESDLDSEGDIVFLDNLLNEYPIPELNVFKKPSTLRADADPPVDKHTLMSLVKTNVFDPRGGEIECFSRKILKMSMSFALFIRGGGGLVSPVMGLPMPCMGFCRLLLVATVATGGGVEGRETHF
ncbi:hypothetical protein Tco_0087172 [Tanacetum coccineum]